MPGCGCCVTERGQANGLWRSGLAAVLLSWTAGTTALELTPSLHLHGFLSQAYLLSDTNDLFGDSSSDGGSWDFRELGANLAWRPRPRLGLAGQLLSRQAGSADDGELRVDYALLDIGLARRGAQRLDLRLGRVKIPLGLYNETRDVAHTRPSILLPQSIYRESARNILVSLDGAMLNWTRPVTDGEFSLDLQLGRLREGDLQELLGTAGLSRFEDSRTAVIRLSCEDWPRNLRYGVNWLRAEVDLEIPGLSPPLARPPGLSMQAEYAGAFVEYAGERWGLAAEWQRQTLRLAGADRLSPAPGLPPQPLIADLRQVTDAWYLQASYRFATGWQAYLRRDVSRERSSDPLVLLGSPVSDQEPAHRRHARDWTLGLRWDLSPQWLLRGEVHWVNGTAWLSTDENRGQALNRRWRLLALQLAYRF